MFEKTELTTKRGREKQDKSSGKCSDLIHHMIITPPALSGLLARIIQCARHAALHTLHRLLHKKYPSVC